MSKKSAVVPAAVAAPVAPTTKSSRRQKAAIIGTRINPARVRRHIDKLNINRTFNTQMAELDAALAAGDGKHARVTLSLTNVSAVTVHHTKKNELDVFEVNMESGESAPVTLSRADATTVLEHIRRTKYRFSENAPIALTVICERVLTQFLTHAMQHSVSKGTSIVRESYCAAPGWSNLPLACLVRQCQSLVSESERFNLPAATPDAAEEVAEDAAAEDAAEDKTNFKFYASNVFNNIKNSNADFSGLRASKKLREFGSSLIKEFLHDMAADIMVLVNSTDVRTINERVICTVVNMILTHNRVDSTTLFNEVNSAIKSYVDFDPATAPVVAPVVKAPRAPKVAAEPKAPKAPRAPKVAAAAAEVAPAAPVAAAAKPRAPRAPKVASVAASVAAPAEVAVAVAAPAAAKPRAPRAPKAAAAQAK